MADRKSTKCIGSLLVYIFTILVYLLTYIVLNKNQKGLPLETNNTQNQENRRLGLIESLHMQQCS